MKSYKILALAAMAVLAAGCCNRAQVSGVLAGVPDSQVVISKLNVNSAQVLDTVKTSATGAFKFNVDVKKDQPEFVYVIYNDNTVASLLLQQGDKIQIQADTLGNCTVEGSEESAKLQGVQQDFQRFVNAFYAAGSDTREMSRLYIEYYRDRVKYVMGNPYSLTVIPVLYQGLGEAAPIFSQTTDAILFRRACDSLKTVYPDSRYVKALEKEAQRREGILNAERIVSRAEETGFPDLSLPGLDGEKIALSSLDNKAILVHFWNAAEGGQKLMNQDILKPIYKEFHSKGLEIYAVCVDIDKAEWATVVKNQELPWINVNDGLGAMSGALTLYNVSELPTTILIANGDISTASISGLEGLRKELKKILK